MAHGRFMTLGSLGCPGGTFLWAVWPSEDLKAGKHPETSRLAVKVRDESWRFKAWPKGTPSGHVKIAMENGDFPQLCNKLPEDTPKISGAEWDGGNGMICLPKSSQPAEHF